MNPIWRLRFKKSALALAAVFVGLLIAEVTLRFFKPPQLSYTHMPCIYIRDEQIGYRYKPNATGWIYRNFEIDNIVRINSEGFHDIEHNLNDKVQRLLVIGDSFTASTHIDISKGWTQTLQRELNKNNYSDIEVINLGLDGTGTNVHLAILKKYLSIFKPHIVILAFYENDVEDVLKKRKFRECYEGYVLSYQNEEERRNLIALVEKHKSRTFSSRLFKNLYLYRVITYLHKRGVLLRTNYITPMRVGINVNEEADSSVVINDVFNELLELSEKYNFKLFVIPVTPKNNPFQSLNMLRQNITETTQSKLNIVDILPIVQNLIKKDRKPYDKLFWKYDGHFNAYGNLIFGLAVADVISSSLKTQLIGQ